ncbi:DMT family transporter [Limnobacter litoralis]|uniref:Transporter n=1 Tax=Limnobacter litoralis TaxID=481366 RepID=A0ABQ5YVF4_9BURK|nr:DMT family transporter [Limnobacter litoralis]GLR26908.1 transporter [Limnobacter litoralis]
MHSFHLTRRQVQLLIVVTLVWGANWPVMKFAVGHYPPISFRTFCMILGMVAMWVIAAASRISLRVPRDKIPLVMMLALPNMVGWHLFCIVGVSQLSSGRAAILGYTMPVWAVLAGLFWGNKVNARGWVGLALAMLAALLLLSSEFSAIAGRPQGVLIMCTAAALWGLGTVLIRRYPTGLHPLALTHAMLLPTIVCMAVAALILEGTSHGLPSGFQQWWPIFYNAIGVFAFCQVAWFSLASSLPPIASSLSVMMIPVVGVFGGSLWLGEVPHWQDFTALALIITAMSVVLIPSRTFKKGV